MFIFNPEDIIILIGIIFITLQDPFRNFVVYDSYTKLKKVIPYAVQDGAIFGIAWTILYVLIAAAVFLIYIERADIHRWVAYVLFSLYAGILVCTKTWVPIFFGLHEYILAKEQKEKKKKPTTSMAYVAYIIAFIDLIILFMFIVCFIVFSIIANPNYDSVFWLPAFLLSFSVVWLLYAGYLNLYAIKVSYYDIDAQMNIKKTTV